MDHGLSYGFPRWMCFVAFFDGGRMTCYFLGVEAGKERKTKAPEGTHIEKAQEGEGGGEGERKEGGKQSFVARSIKKARDRTIDCKMAIDAWWLGNAMQCCFFELLMMMVIIVITIYRSHRHTWDLWPCMNGRPTRTIIISM